MPFIVATYVYASSQVQRTHSARTNIWFVKTETGLEPTCTSSAKLKAVLESKLATIPDREKWRVRYLARLPEERGQAHYEGDDVHQLADLIDSLCTS